MASGAGMRELHINGKFTAHALTGTERYATEVLKAWSVLLQPGDTAVTLHLPSDGTCPAWLPPWWSVRRSRLRGVLFEQLSLLVQSGRGFLVSLAGPACLLKRRQLVVMHDAAPMRFPHTFTPAFVAWYRMLYWVLARRAAALATVSNFSRQELAAALGVPAERFTVAPCGADHFRDLQAVSAPPVGGAREPFVVCVGTLAVHKNLVPMVRALSARQCTVLVVGVSGKQRIFAADAELGSGPHVHVLARISDQELAALYDRALALVFPSRYEGFGLPVVEAQARGTAVICSTADSLPEVAGAGALYFDPDDPARGAEHVVDLASDAALLAQMKERALKNAARFTWRETGEALLEAVGRRSSS